MTRTISSTLARNSTPNMALNPSCLLKSNGWTADSAALMRIARLPIRYSPDRRDCSIDSTVKTDGNTDSSQVRLTLEDTDGAIKTICDSHDLHNARFGSINGLDGLALSDKFLLFKGEINSPLPGMRVTEPSALT